MSADHFGPGDQLRGTRASHGLGWEQPFKQLIYHSGSFPRLATVIIQRSWPKRPLHSARCSPGACGLRLEAANASTKI